MSARRWAPPLAWAAVILILTSIPGPDLPIDLTGIDKLAHFGSYFVLGLLASRAALQRESGWKRALLVIAAIAILGALDELHQQFIPGRDMDIHDWFADALGAIVAALFIYTLVHGFR